MDLDEHIGEGGRGRRPPSAITSAGSSTGRRRATSGGGSGASLNHMRTLGSRTRSSARLLAHRLQHVRVVGDLSKLSHAPVKVEVGIGVARARLVRSRSTGENGQ